MQLVQLSKHIPAVAVGALFIISAGLKLLGMAAFEMYLYEFNVVSFEAAALFSRLIIAAELAIGIALLANIKWADYVAGAMLLAFSIFLFVQVKQGNTGNCHCMGEVFDLPADKSLSKNIMMLMLLFWGHRMTNYFKQSKKNWVITSVSIVLVSLIAVFAINRPDFMRLIREREYSQIKLTELLQQKFPSALEGDKIVCVLSTHCGMCKMAARRMEGIFVRHDWKDNEILTVFSDTRVTSAPIEEEIDSFFVETKVKRRNVITMYHDSLYEVAPRVPTIFLLKDGIVQKTHGYRSILTDDFAKNKCSYTCMHSYQ